VYRAEHVKLGREVALKLLKPQYASRRDSVARFFQEARAVNRIRHRNIVDITDFVEIDDGTVFIIMELLRGAPLRDLAREPGALSLPRALSMLSQITDALAAAHDVGIVHRDMKPDNIFIVDRGDGADLVKLLDFGVAKLIAQEEESAWETKAGSVIGTPAYMSPEQAGGLQVDGRSDVYSVGAIMYELFTGEPLFRARSFGEYVRKHLSEEPVPPRRTPGGAGLDARIEQMILRCLQKSPDARYPSMRALNQDLLAMFGAIETGAPAAWAAMTPSGHAPPGLTPHGTHPSQTAPVPRESIGRSPALWFGLGAAGLGLAAGVAFFLAASGSGDTRADDTPAPALNSAVRRASPVVSPIASPSPEPAPPELITVRFTSDPSGASVTPDGSATTLCLTPCDVSIDPSDGGSLRERRYTLRRKGHHAERVTIPLAKPPEQRHIPLRALGGGGMVMRDIDDPEVPEDVLGDPTANGAAPAAGETKRASPDKIDPEDTLDPFGSR
jgi:serine/threonine-protein kinase